MNKEHVPPISELVGKYIDGSLSDLEWQALLRAMEQNEGATRMLASGVLTHLLLEKHFGKLRDVSQGCKTEPEDSFVPEDVLEASPEDAVANWAPHPLYNGTRNVAPVAEPATPSEKEYDPFAVYEKKNLLNSTTVRRWELWPLITSVTIFVIVIGLAEWQAYRASSRRATLRVESEVVPLATVQNLCDVVWLPGDNNPKRGHKIGPVNMAIESGIVNLVVNNGTKLLIEGPADFAVQPNGNLFCGRGRVSVAVPPTGQGFTVSTPWAKIIDRGTEFMVNVDENRSQVHVIKGQVELVKDGEMIPLTAGLASFVNAISLSPPKQEAPQKYISPELFQSMLYDRWEKKQAENTQKNLQWDNHPSLLCRFDMGSMKDGKVINTSRRGNLLCPTMDLHECDLVQETPEETAAVHFRNQRSYGQLALPGEHDSLSLVCSIRIDRLLHNGNVIFVSDNYFKKTGGFLWQISSEGQLLFHVTTNDSGLCDTFVSRPVFKNQFCGGWYTFAVVIDGKNRKISHYLDGQLVESIPWTRPTPLKAEKGMVGNYIDSQRTINNRYLMGNMNRFYVFDGVLSEKELLDLHIEH